MTKLSDCVRCGHSDWSHDFACQVGHCRCAGYKGMPEPWAVRRSGNGFAVVSTETGETASWHPCRGEAQKVANDFTIEGAKP